MHFSADVNKLNYVLAEGCALMEEIKALRKSYKENSCYPFIQ